jgi:hypothetical protein
MRPIEKVNLSGMLEVHDDHFTFCTNRQTQLYMQAANHITVLAIEASIQSATKSKSASLASFHSMSAFPAKPMEMPKAVLGIRSIR